MQSAAKRFPELFARVEKDHEGLQEGHDIEHVKRVTHYGGVIYRAEWPGDERGAQITEFTCLFHNADRVLEKRIGKENVTRALIGEQVRRWFSPLYVLLEGEQETVLNAVLAHNDKNKPDHSNVAKALRDADRVVNLELDVVIRAGQRYHEKPPLDYDRFFRRPPDFNNPQTVMEDLALSLEWVDPSLPHCMQTPTGMKLGMERAAALHYYFNTLKYQLKESGYFAE